MLSDAWASGLPEEGGSGKCGCMLQYTGCWCVIVAKIRAGSPKWCELYRGTRAGRAVVSQLGKK